MKKTQKKAQLVSAVQEYVTQEGLSPADVVRVVHSKGGDVSDSAIRRVLKADANKDNFAFETLQQISNALFAINEKPMPAEDINSPETAEIEALRAVTALTDVEYQEAQEKILILEKQLAEALERLSVLSDAERRITQLEELCEFRKQQMIVKDSQIERLWKMVER